MIPLTGTNGLFTRIGKIGSTINAVNENRGTTIPAEISGINTQYEDANQDIITNLYTNLSSYQSSSGVIMSPLQRIAQDTVVDMCNEDLRLSNLSISTALTFLIDQMKGSGRSVDACSLASTVTYSPLNIGNPNVVVSLKNVNGYVNENIFAELITGTITSDSQYSSSITGAEPFVMNGQYTISDTFSWLYPDQCGSGSAISLSAVNAMRNSAGGNANWLYNGSMELWSGGLPLNWHADAGSGFVAQATGVKYDGNASLSFVGNAGTNTSIYQTFSSPQAQNDTNVVIFPNTQFAFNAFIRTSATPPSGVLQVSLVSGAAGAFVITNDNAGTPNSISVNLNTIGTTWTTVSGSFRTPNHMPPPISLRMRLSTDLPASYTLYVDRIAFTQSVQFYQDGPYITLFSGNINLIKNDTFWIDIDNDYGGQFQILFQKLFDMRSLSLLLPSNATGGENIPDSLI